ncbi:hypothetical protein niasHT_001474 [Heterodera trifolii]|uniref:UBA domain-containing protein n=1 Tax=Heterodera trifolii TaxID=157864 RepID=A0ABD2LQR1_9BILA
MELQKQPVMATKEQLRLAELTQTGHDATIAHDDIAGQKRVKKVIELTRCTQSQAEVALIDSEGNVEDAVARLLDSPEKLVLWSQQGKKQKTKSSTPSVARTTTTHNQTKGKGQNEQNSAGPRVRTERQGQGFNKGQNRTFTGGAYRRDNVAANKQTTNKVVGTAGTNTGDFSSTVEQSYGETAGHENDEWKNGPRVFMPSSAAATTVVMAETSTNGGVKWPALDNFTPSVEPAAEPAAVHKPKTFAAVAAAKKASPPPPPPQHQQQQQQQQTITYESREPDWTKENWTSEPTNWSSENWASSGKLESTEILDNQDKLDTTEKLENTDMLGTVGNIEAADNLDTSGMLDTNCKLDTAGMMDNHCDTAGMLDTNVDQAQEKVEFVTGEALPHPTSTSYQFGFHFSSAKDNESTWGQPIENSAGSMLNSMANIPTTSSSVSALTAIFEAHQQRLNNNGGPARPPTGNALSFSDTASVNFPPSSGQPGGGGPVVVHGGNAVNFAAAAAAAHQQQQQQAAGDQSQHVAAVHHHHQQQQHQQQQQLPPQQNKTLFTPAANPAMVSATPAMQQHLQQQAQTIFHQTSATAVPQFPSYNMPYMYSPVATAQTLQGPNAEIDRFLIQQYGTPYSQLDLQMGAMSIGPPTTLAPNHHRATLESYMENKFGQQQQNVNQAANNGHYQQTQQSQQQQRGLAQSEQATLLGGPPSHVGPPPGFGMPTAPTQPSYVQPANIHSLFQMPTYPHPYQHPQYMMSNANRFQAAQRPAQTSPPDANVQNQRRGGGDAQGYAGGAVPDSTSEQHSAAVSQQYGNNFNHKYRSYM